jgi:hypothetical protein
MTDLDDKTYAGLVELLRDAESCARLTQWEEEFLDDFRARVLLYKQKTQISDQQRTVLLKIEGKIYA